MFALLLGWGFSAAQARPAPPTPIVQAVAQAEHVVVAKPVSVEFQWLANGGVLETSTLAGFEREFEVVKVLRGTVKVGERFKLPVRRAGCRSGRVRIERRGDRFVQLAEESSPEVEVSPADYLAGEQMLLLNGPANDLSHTGRWVSPMALTDERVAEVRRLLN